nr:immunoglobulin light chain junction region [Macaca mulatta]MOW65280.1 immunoglobulin light chain junction region [Macaca mulatta]
CHQYNSAPFTF